MSLIYKQKDRFLVKATFSCSDRDSASGNKLPRRLGLSSQAAAREAGCGVAMLAETAID